ncbi:MAG TPA: hypothetical protein VKY56_11280 [Chloroflexota bacterium]|nr:hypothetical protein [Chloroflexota bacterium]
MIRDYETPTVPTEWQTYARSWADRLGLGDRQIVLSCSPDRYGIAVVLRLLGPDGQEYVFTRRSSEADDAAERRQAFLTALREGSYRTVEIDVAGYYVSEGTVPCSICTAVPSHAEWQHVILRELLRIADPPPEPADVLTPEEADDAELAALDKQVAHLLSQPAQA